MKQKKPKCHPNRKYNAKDLCKRCYQDNYYDENKKKVNAYNKRWKKKNPKKVKKSKRKVYLKSKYNITLKQYKKLLKMQNYKCAIKKCKNKYSVGYNLKVDHDHKTNKIRGLLCNNCNLRLGHFQDNYKLLQSACEYLKVKYKIIM